MLFDLYNPIYLLALIRDKRLRTFDDLSKLQSSAVRQEISRQIDSTDRFRKDTEVDRETLEMVAMQLGVSFKHTVESLIEEGFVIETDDGFKVHQLVDKLKPVLNISLAELATKPKEALWVNPIFRTRLTANMKYDVFVVMPFADKLKPVFDNHIKSVCSNLNLSVARADDFFTTNSIMEDVWAGILAAKVIIADCTGRNPNVFYEIGIAHTLGKQVVLLAQDIKDVPFDLKYLRCIVYTFTPSGMVKFEQDLSSTIKVSL